MKPILIISLEAMLGILIIFGCISAAVAPPETKVYYVDSASGNDNNTGTSSSTPWKSLSVVNNKTFSPGEKILFKAGSVWNDNLTLKGSGTEGKPIVIDMYGKGNKPAIIGKQEPITEETTVQRPMNQKWPVVRKPGENNAVITISNSEYIEINNLDISGDYAINGIYVEGGEEILNHIYIRNCEIHDLTVGGGYSRGNGMRINGRHLFNDMRIKNNLFKDLSGDGFMINGDAKATNITNLYVANNTVLNVAGDGIVIRDAYKPIIEYNYVNNCAYMEVPHHAGIWCAFTDSAIFQYNECCFVKKLPNNNDGMSFDTDFGAINTVFQYNYSHDNEGGFHLSMGSDKFITIRYNISVNDGLRLFFQGFPAPTCHIYNNIFYGPAALTNKSVLGGTWYNNIFWSTGAEYAVPPLGSNNITWGNATGGIHVDPGLINPTEYGTRIDLKSKKRLAGFKLKKGSPCIDAGIVVENNGKRDFWGKPLYNGLPDIGAMEFYK